MANYQKKCEFPRCSIYFVPENATRRYCEEHKPKLTINNKEGYNRYKKNKNKKPELVKELTPEDIKEAYRERLRAESIYKGKASQHAKMESKFFGYDKIKKEIEEEMGEEDGK